MEEEIKEGMTWSFASGTPFTVQSYAELGLGGRHYFCLSVRLSDAYCCKIKQLERAYFDIAMHLFSFAEGTAST